MLSVNYSFKVPDYKELSDSVTFVRGHATEFELVITNDGATPLNGINVSLVLESYVGQVKPQLFLNYKAARIDKVLAKGTIPVNMIVWPLFPGIVSIAIYLKDNSDKMIMCKRSTETEYQEAPVRYWFYVEDNIAVDTLVALKTLVKASSPQKSLKKRQIK